MDGVMFVSDDKWAWGWRNEAGRLFQRLGDAYRKERFVILREEDDGGRAMVMSDDERVRPGKLNEWMNEAHSTLQCMDLWLPSSYLEI